MPAGVWNECRLQVIGNHIVVAIPSDLTGRSLLIEMVFFSFPSWDALRARAVRVVGG